MVQRNPGKSPINELLLDRFRTVSSFSVESPTTAFREHQFCRIDGRGGDDGGSLVFVTVLPGDFVSSQIKKSGE